MVPEAQDWQGWRSAFTTRVALCSGLVRQPLGWKLDKMDEKGGERSVLQARPKAQGLGFGKWVITILMSMWSERWQKRRENVKHCCNSESEATQAGRFLCENWKFFESIHQHTKVAFVERFCVRHMTWFVLLFAWDKNMKSILTGALLPVRRFEAAVCTRSSFDGHFTSTHLCFGRRVLFCPFANRALLSLVDSCWTKHFDCVTQRRYLRDRALDTQHSQQICSNNTVSDKGMLLWFIWPPKDKNTTLFCCSVFTRMHFNNIAFQGTDLRGRAQAGWQWCWRFFSFFFLEPTTNKQLGTNKISMKALSCFWKGLLKSNQRRKWEEGQNLVASLAHVSHNKHISVQMYVLCWCGGGDEKCLKYCLQGRFSRCCLFQEKHTAWPRPTHSHSHSQHWKRRLHANTKVGCLCSREFLECNWLRSKHKMWLFLQCSRACMDWAKQLFFTWVQGHIAH